MDVLGDIFAMFNSHNRKQMKMTNGKYSQFYFKIKKL